MQFDLRKFIATGRQPYHAEFQCDLSAHDYAGARISQPVTAVFDAETDGEEIRMTLRAKASVHGECARCLDPVTREETVDTEWTVKEREICKSESLQSEWQWTKGRFRIFSYLLPPCMSICIIIPWHYRALQCFLHFEGGFIMHSAD